MWKWLWPGRETPIGHVTNGVHLGTWLDPALAELLRDAGVRPEAPPDEAGWQAAREVSPDALWSVHAAAKARLAERAGIDRELLTIGFARRFATYKRAGLVFSDVERLLALPVQIVVAGKAHPADVPGKDVMQEIVELGRDPRSKGRIVFLENYDIGLARTLVRGCDVWLNTPQRPLEASGTSGMKAARERRPQPLRARRLVGGGVLARTSAGRSTASPTTPTASSSTACSRTRSCRRSPRTASAGSS